MKGVGFFGSIVVGLVVAVVVALYLEPWAERQKSSAEALRVEVNAGAWSPFPMSESADVSRAWRREGYTDAIIQTIERGDRWNMAQLVLRNPGSKAITDIRFNFGEYPPTTLLLQQAGEPLRRVTDPRELTVSDLAPGQTASIFVWSSMDLSRRLYYSDWQTYSSSGAARFVFPGDRSRVSSLFDEWALRIAIGGIILLGILLAVAIFVHERYVQRLMANDGFLQAERERYVADPVMFRPSP